MNFLQKIAQFLLLLGLALYLGGMVALGAIAAPQLFNTVRQVQGTSPLLPPEPDAPAQLGGEIFGNILRQFAYMEWLSIGCIVVALLIQIAAPLWRGVWGVLRAIIVVVLITVAFYDGFHLTPNIWAERQAWRDAVARSQIDAVLHHDRFNTLHQESELLGHIKTYLLLGLLILTACRTTPRSPVSSTTA